MEEQKIIQNGEMDFFERKSEEFKFRQKHQDRKHKTTKMPEKIRKEIKKQLSC